MKGGYLILHNNMKYENKMVMESQLNKFQVKGSLDLLRYLDDLFKNKELSLKSIEAVIDNNIQICEGCKNDFYKDIIGGIGLISNINLLHLLGIYDSEIMRSYVMISDKYANIKARDDAIAKLLSSGDQYQSVMNDLSKIRRSDIISIKADVHRVLQYMEIKLFPLLNFNIRNDYVQLYILFAMIGKGADSSFNNEHE